MFFRAFILTLALASSLVAQDFSENGRFDRVDIAGFRIPVTDADILLGQGVLRFDPNRERFSFGPGVTSERALKRTIRELPLQDPRALRDLYRANKVPFPNRAAHTLTIPSGYGPAIFSNQPGRGVSLGLGVGGVSRTAYREDPDGGVGFSLGFGNSFETVGVSLRASLNDISDLGNSDRVSFGFELSRYISDGLSVSFGGENLFVRETDGQESFYAVGSWAFERGVLPFDGVATLGLGSGRFAEKSERDVFEGKGSDATILFGALAWHVNDNVNLIADWNGRNLSMGIAARLPKSPISVRVGVTDLTDYTGDGVRLVGSVGLTVLRF